MSQSFNKAVEVCNEIMRWKVSPYMCLYLNPNKYSLVEFARWSQKYLNYKVYLTLLETSKITGFEPVPIELLYGNPGRSGFSGRKVKVGKFSFYLLKPDEMGKQLKERFNDFKDIIKNQKNDGIK